MRAVLLLAICGAVSACATTGDTLRSGEVDALRASVSQGDPIAARRLAGLIAQGRLPGATIAEAVVALEGHPTGPREQALLAELEAGRGRTERAFSHCVDSRARRGPCPAHRRPGASDP
jgi:hypothetical protein